LVDAFDFGLSDFKSGYESVAGPQRTHLADMSQVSTGTPQRSGAARSYGCGTYRPSCSATATATQSQRSQRRNAGQLIKWLNGDSVACGEAQAGSFDEHAWIEWRQGQIVWTRSTARQRIATECAGTHR